MGKLTTHVLDTSCGEPGSGITVAVFLLDHGRQELARAVTNADGRCDQPLLQGEALSRGRYELVFSVGDYFRRMALQLPDPPFVDEVVLRFGVADPERHYHIPLLVSPWSYATYRGS